MPLTLTPSLSQPTDEPPADALQGVLARLGSEPGSLPAYSPLVTQPRGIDPAELDAVARAASCPDLFVVSVADAAVGERFIVHLVQTVRHCDRPEGRTVEPAGERVLVLSPSPAAADRIAESLSRAGIPDVVRALGPDENPMRPSEPVSRLTSVAWLAAQRERLLREAAEAVAEAEARLAHLDQIRACHERADRLREEITATVARRDSIEAEVRQEAAQAAATPLNEALARLEARSAQTLAPLRAELDALTQQADAKETALQTHRDELARLRQAATQRSRLARLWLCWLARLQGRVPPDEAGAELEATIRRSEAELADLQDRAARIRSRLDAETEQHQAARESLIRNEAAARRNLLNEQLASLTAEAEQLRTTLEVLHSQIGGQPAAAEPRDSAVLRSEAGRALAAARERAAEVERTADLAACRAVQLSGVIVGTPASVRSDPILADGDPTGRDRAEPPFGLLVLDCAEELTEPIFRELACLGCRHVLVGSLAGAAPLRGPSAPRKTTEARWSSGARGWYPTERSPASSFLARLQPLLDRETWGSEDGRLVCRLRHLSPSEQRTVTCEPLLDRPEIELRFAELSDGSPVLAEIVFPAGTTVASAKAFVYQQLGEALVRPCGPLHRYATPDGWRVCWPALEALGLAPTWVELEPGLREGVVGTGIAVGTCALAFEAAAGWDAERVEHWLAEHVPTTYQSRFARLPDGR